MKKLPILLSCILLLAIGGAFGQEQSGAIKTATGLLIVWNEPGNCYTVEIKGAKIEPIPNQTLWFQVDGKFFQIATPKVTAFAKDLKEDRAILTAHMQWEADYIGSLLKTRITPTSTWLKLPNGIEAISWSFDMPKVAENQTAKKQLYLAVVKRDHVLLVNSPVEGDEDEKVIFKLLTETMSTLKSTDKPLSLQKASEMVKSGT
jgi:hypothetical protein